MDALLDECVMVEQELGQFSQELGLRVVDVLAAARGEDDLGADDDVQRGEGAKACRSQWRCCQWVLQSWRRLVETWQLVGIG